MDRRMNDPVLRANDVWLPLTYAIELARHPDLAGDALTLRVTRIYTRAREWQSDWGVPQ
jgi:hypothetical protein